MTKINWDRKSLLVLSKRSKTGAGKGLFPAKVPSSQGALRAPVARESRFFAYRATQTLCRQGELGKPLVRLPWAISLRRTGKRCIPILPPGLELTQVKHQLTLLLDPVFSREKDYRRSSSVEANSSVVS
jgi:hypothetical protein